MIDMNPIFRLLSRSSEWIDYGRDVASLNAVEDHFPAAVAALRPQKNIDTWLGAGSGDFGRIVRVAAERE